MAFDRCVTYVKRAGWGTSHITVDRNKEQSQFHSSTELEQVKGQQDNRMTYWRAQSLFARVQMMLQGIDTNKLYS